MARSAHGSAGPWPVRAKRGRVRPASSSGVCRNPGSPPGSQATPCSRRHQCNCFVPTTATAVAGFPDGLLDTPANWHNLPPPRRTSSRMATWGCGRCFAGGWPGNRHFRWSVCENVVAEGHRATAGQKRPPGHVVRLRPKPRRTTRLLVAVMVWRLHTAWVVSGASSLMR